MEEQSIWIKANCWVVYERRGEERREEERRGEMDFSGRVLQHKNSFQSSTSLQSFDIECDTLKWTWQQAHIHTNTITAAEEQTHTYANTLTYLTHKSSTRNRKITLNALTHT